MFHLPKSPVLIKETAAAKDSGSSLGSRRKVGSLSAFTHRTAPSVLGDELSVTAALQLNWHDRAALGAKISGRYQTSARGAASTHVGLSDGILVHVTVVNLGAVAVQRNHPFASRIVKLLHQTLA